MTSASTERDHEAGGRRLVTQVSSLSALVGAHPDAIEKIYRAAPACDPEDLGDAPRGRFLAIAPVSSVHLAMRPFLRALATDALPWRGKTFDHGGNSGTNVIFGKHAYRFHAEVGPSVIDERPALVLTYDEPAYKNPWPLTKVRDELRTIGQGIAIGPAFMMGGSPTLLVWWGLESSS